jgi:DNA repair protein SbcD/Mre11
MKIIHFADLHLGVETYGHLNPETGLSSRLQDYLNVLDQVIDFALQEKVDLVLFCGDAYKTREPTQTQQREFAKRIKRLSEGGVPLFMVIGNHDLPNALGRATAIEIFDTLAVPDVCVANKPGIHRVKTRSGEIQIAALPWVRRSALLSREDTRNLDFNQINEKLQQILTGIISEQASQIDPAVPSILAAHVWVLNARIGTEKSMSIGQEHMLLLGSVANPVFDYVALGHIHKGQVLNECPPTIYSGSLERLDFGDEGDEKGFYLIEIAHGQPSSGGRKVSYCFHPVNARRFFTLPVDIDHQELDPTSRVLQQIEINRHKIREAIVRIEISLPAAVSGKLRDYDIRSAAGEAYYLTVVKDIQRESRLRLGKGALEGITPLEALKAWLEINHKPERARTLLEFGEKLIQDRSRQD